jgi:hypothetical protein
MRSAFAKAGLILAVTALTACDPQPTGLDGSLADAVDLSYSRVVLDLDVESCALRFLRPRGTGEDTVLKIGITTTNATLTGTGVDLSERLPSNGQRAIVTRNVFDDPNKKLPELVRGNLTLAADPATAATVKGTLNMTFVPGFEFGTGTTVYGEFEAQVAKP